MDQLVCSTPAQEGGHPAGHNPRIHRQGQTSKVMIHHLTVKDSIDDAVIDALSAKDQTQEALLAALKYRVKQIREKNRSLDLTLKG